MQADESRILMTLAAILFIRVENCFALYRYIGRLLDSMLKKVHTNMKLQYSWLQLKLLTYLKLTPK